MRQAVLPTRREAIGTMLVACLGAREVAGGEKGPEQEASPGRWRGVNLGGWLVLERWMTPGLFEGTEAQDEFSWCKALGARGAERLKRHRETWITEEDFAWIAGRGLNAVRLPVGYWLLEGDGPFLPGAEYADRAFDWGARHNLGVLLDLHGAPGSQNGWDHSGKAGESGWHRQERNIERTLEVLEALARRYASRPNLVGIELMNEPRWDVPLEALKPFYRAAYERIRRHVSAERVSVVFHDGFRLDQWGDTLRAPEAENTVLDTHIYQCFKEEDRERDIHGQIERAAVARRKELDQASALHKVIVGEWSLALDPRSLRGLDGFSLDVAKRAYAAAQLVSYERTRGWFYWSYKLEEPSDWNFRHAVERGWMPEEYGRA